MDEITLQQLVADSGGKLSWQDAANILVSAIEKLQAEYDTQTVYADVTPSQMKLDKKSHAVVSCGVTYSLSDWDASNCAERGVLPWEFLNKWSSRTAAAQVYPLAVCFYFSVSGEMPFSAEQRLEGSKLQTLAERGVEIPTALDAAIFKELALNSCERYSSLAEFKAAISPLVENAKIQNAAINAASIDLSKIRSIPAGKNLDETYHPTETRSEGFSGKLISVIAIACAFSVGLLFYQLRAKPAVHTLQTNLSASGSVVYSSADSASEAASSEAASSEAASSEAASAPESTVTDETASSSSVSSSSVEPKAASQAQEAAASSKATSSSSSSRAESKAPETSSSSTPKSTTAASSASEPAASTNSNQTITFDDGSKFVGTVNGEQYTGTITAVNGDVYTGAFTNGLLEGQGTLKTASGDSYKGNFSLGKQDGTGTMTYADGSVYSGSWSGGERSGSGTLKYTNGDSFNGNWTANLKDGSGTYTWANGSTYTGLWRAGKALPGGTYNYTDDGVTEWLTSGRLTMLD